MDELLKAAAVEYYKRYPMTGIYANLPIDSELFMSALVGIIDDEKEYKKAVKGGYTKLIVYTDPKTRFQMLAKFPTTESMEKYIAEGHNGREKVRENRRFYHRIKGKNKALFSLLILCVLACFRWALSVVYGIL